MEKLRAGVIGATGYGGRETIKLLLNHPDVEISLVAADDSFIDTKVSDTYPELKGIADMVCVKSDVSAFCKACDIVLLATPNAIAMKMAPEFLKNNVKVIDYSGDFRLKDLKVYEAAYGIKHACPDLIEKAVYGMPELFREDIKGASLISNPGCFPTSVILGLAPLVKKGLVYEKMTAISITGTSGAGRKGLLPFIMSEMEGNVKPYKVGVHQHEPEINEILGLVGGTQPHLTFAPQAGPFSRGILSAVTLHLKENIKTDALVEQYRAFYEEESFVRVMDAGSFPELKNVVYTNFCDIGLYCRDDKTCIVYAAVDNLIKGLSGQAIQNLNLMYGMEETVGIL